MTTPSASHAPRHPSEPAELISPHNHELSAPVLWQRRDAIVQHLKEIAQAAEDAKAPESQQKQRLAFLRVLLCGPLYATSEVERGRRLVQGIAIVEQKVAAAAGAGAYGIDYGCAVAQPLDQALAPRAAASIQER